MPACTFLSFWKVHCFYFCDLFIIIIIIILQNTNISWNKSENGWEVHELIQRALDVFIHVLSSHELEKPSSKQTHSILGSLIRTFSADCRFYHSDYSEASNFSTMPASLFSKS
jgi:hypothetical protein